VAQKPGSVKSNNSRTVELTIRAIIAVIFGVVLYLSVPVYSVLYLSTPIPSKLSLLILPLLCGAFAWLVTRDAYYGAASSILITMLGSIIVWQNIFELLPGFPFSLFVIMQIILGIVPALVTYFAKVDIKPEYLALALLFVLMLNFLVVTSNPSTDIASGSAIEPPAESFAFDGIFFLKMFYLVDQGMNFYEAYDLGFQHDKRFDAPPPIIGGWRMPTTFWFWSVIASRGDHLVNYFVFFSLILMACAYLVASKFTEPAFALISASLVGTYMLFGSASWWYTELEYWGLFLALPAATLYLYDKRYWALPLALLAGLMREWIALILIAGLIVNLINRRWVESGIWATACALVGGAYFLNIHNIVEYTKQANLPLSLEAAGMGQGGIGFILYTLQYGSGFFNGGLGLIYILFFTGIIGAVVTGIRTKNFYWAALIILPLTVFMFYGSGRVPGDPPGWNDYYNINFMPYILVAVPFMAKPLIDAGLWVAERLDVRK